MHDKTRRWPRTHSKHDSPTAPAGRGNAAGDEDDDDLYLRTVKDPYGSFAGPGGGFKLKF